MKTNSIYDLYSRSGKYHEVFTQQFEESFPEVAVFPRGVWPWPPDLVALRCIAPRDNLFIAGPSFTTEH